MGYEIGANYGALVTLASVDLPDPESQFTTYSSTVVTGSGKTRGLGYPQATWHYGYLTQGQYDTLVSYLTDVGTALAIRTLNHNGDYIAYTANAELPTSFIQRGPDSKLRYLDVTLKFNTLVGAS